MDEVNGAFDSVLFRPCLAFSREIAQYLPRSRHEADALGRSGVAAGASDKIPNHATPKLSPVPTLTTHALVQNSRCRGVQARPGADYPEMPEIAALTAAPTGGCRK